MNKQQLINIAAGVICPLALLLTVLGVSAICHSGPAPQVCAEPQSTPPVAGELDRAG